MAHRCDERCHCPHHGTMMHYWPKGDDHACQDITCEYARGFNQVWLNNVFAEYYGVARGI
jgi:hypothetical protein